jgi:hypothetical protein
MIRHIPISIGQLLATGWRLENGFKKGEKSGSG